MSKPLKLFIQPPYDNPPGLWTLIYGYGLDKSSITGPTFHSHMLLNTIGNGEVLAVADGKLSMRPPGIGVADPSEEFPLTLPPGLDDPIPDTINLYLHLSPIAAREPLFKARAGEISGLVGFAYLNIETASLEAELAELLDYAIIPPGGFTRTTVVEMLVRGQLDVYVTAGHTIGKASHYGAAANSRRIGFSILTPGGAICPSYVYDLMRDFVSDGQPDIDAFLHLAPKKWPVIDTNYKDIAIGLTQIDIYSMKVLQYLKDEFDLSSTEWRQVGDNQKNLWRKRLLKRAGHALEGSTDPPFEFDDMDWQNIFQLEAVVEFYANYDDPWAGGATPRDPDEVKYNKINFLNLAGTNAQINPLDHSIIMLEDAIDLTMVRENYDTIYFDSDTSRKSRTYRIINKYPTAVALKGEPNFDGASAWKINLRPIIIIIDAFGYRLKGKNAIVENSATPNVVTLDSLPKTSSINPFFDTIYVFV